MYNAYIFLQIFGLKIRQLYPEYIQQLNQTTHYFPHVHEYNEYIFCKHCWNEEGVSKRNHLVLLTCASLCIMHNVNKYFYTSREIT